MSKEIKRVEQITSQEADFAQWYTDVCLKAELMDYTDTKGFIIYRPYGYAIWENIQAFLNKEFKKTGHENVYMPLVISETLFQKEKDHVDGFSPETAMVSLGDDSERHILRPTSEVLFASHYAKIIQSHRDLPKLYNQWANVVRLEKTTRPFLRGKEFLWQEGHTAHATKEEAVSETLQMLGIYEKLGTDLLAIPFVTGRKTEKEKFAGAIDTYSIEALMPDGQALQSGTSHYFGQGFAKAFDIKFQTADNKLDYVYQTSWGVTTRLIGATIMVHGDNEGLVMPPYVAPTQIIIIPIQSQKQEVADATNKIFADLKDLYRVKLDDSNKSPGWKFSEYEMKGVPIRIEVGPRDLANGVVTIATRYNNLKQTVKLEDLVSMLPNLLSEIHNNMLTKAKNYVKDNTNTATNYDQFKELIKKGGYVKMSIVGEEAEIKIKEDTGATARVIPFDQTLVTDVCPVTNKKATQTILFARAY